MCNNNDSGRMQVNPQNFLDNRTLQEIHLHPVDGGMAVSPNNCAFLVNLNFPVVNFVITMLHERPEQDGMTLSFFNITLLNDQMIGEMAIYQALDAEILL